MTNQAISRLFLLFLTKMFRHTLEIFEQHRICGERPKGKGNMLRRLLSLKDIHQRFGGHPIIERISVGDQLNGVGMINVKPTKTRLSTKIEYNLKTHSQMK